MIIRSEKVLKYYLYKQLFTSPLPGDSSVLSIIEKTGFPKEQNALLSFYLRVKNFQAEKLSKSLQQNIIIEVKTFKNKRLFVPRNIARNFIQLIPLKEPSLIVRSCSKVIYQKLKQEPLNLYQITEQTKDYSPNVIKLSIEYLESRHKILKILNVVEKKFEFVLTQEILDSDLSQKSNEQVLAEVIYSIIQNYGPLSISELAKYTGISLIEIQRAFKYIRKNISSIKIDSYPTTYLMENKDLTNLQKHKSESIDHINIVPKVDHAFSLSQGWLYRSIPLYSKLDLLVIFNSDVVGGFSSIGGFDSFVQLPKLVLNEISNKHISLLQWTKRKLV